MRRLLLLCALAVAAAGALPATVSAAPPSSPPGDEGPERRFIITLEAGVDAPSAAREWRGRGARVDHVYTHAMTGFAGRMTPETAARLGRDKRVAAVEEDRIVRVATAQTSAPWGLDRLDQRSLPLDGSFTYGPDGAGVTAYVLDSGVRATHTAFGGRVAPGFTAIADGRGTDDCHGHGTHVAGTIGGTVHGVAKAVTIVPVRVLGCDGTGPTSGVIAGIDWVAAHHTAGAPAVANLSLGGGASFGIDAAVRNGVADGVTFVAAAGNEDVDACGVSPARVAVALTVGASTWNDARSSFSNWGSCVDLFAPGSVVRSAHHTSDTATVAMSGTSMAAPHVAGIAALYLSAVPSAAPKEVGEAVIVGATPDLVTDPKGSANLLASSRIVPGGPK